MKIATVHDHLFAPLMFRLAPEINRSQHHFSRIVNWFCLLLIGLTPLHAMAAQKSIIAENLLYVVLLLAVLMIFVQALLLTILSRRFKHKKPSSDDGSHPQLLAKTKQQLYREVTRHEATEELLRKTQEYMQCMINSMPSILIGITPEGFITHWNLAAEKTTGLAADETLGEHINQVYPELPVNMAMIEETIILSRPYRNENIQSGQGSNATFIDLTIYPLVAEEISGAVILATDTTLRVRVENMMVQNEKMMSLGEMAAGLAHELNNPLAGILNNTQNIIRRSSPTLPANLKAAEELGIDVRTIQSYLDKRGILQFVESIRDAGERAAQIVKNMLDFSRGNNTKHIYTNIRKLVEHSLELAANTFELMTSSGVEALKIKREFQAELPQIPCSPTEIQQVILNLLRNAVQAFQSDEYGPPLEPEVTVKLHKDNAFMIIEVTDNGPGIPDSIKRQIFDPFFTTKDVGKGTGLGLSVSYFIITEHHQGTIEVDSSPGEGTTFIIKLPLEKHHEVQESILSV